VEDALHIAANNRLGHEAVDGQQYKKLLVRAVGMTVGMLYVKQSVAERVKGIQCAGVGVGVWEMGNKGALGIRIGVDDSELTFVAAHLAPMEGEVLRRNKDWENIVRGLVFEDVDTPPSPRLGVANNGEAEPLLSHRDTLLSGQTGLYKPRNTIFFGGDLNYRTSLKPPEPDTHKTYPQPDIDNGRQPVNTTPRITIKELLARDQLVQERLAGRTIHGFSEMPIHFSPTYKYDNKVTGDVPGPEVIPKPSDADVPGEDPIEEPQTWHWARHRWPSWCDRILYLPSSGLEPHVYTSLPLLPSSDHRAVALSVTLRPAVAAEAFGDDDLRNHPPFPLNPDWKAQRAAARRREIIVGIASYLTLTVEGNAILIGLLGGGFAGYLMLRTLL
jgi:hypothetical protein